jgi:hypothetical protein
MFDKKHRNGRAKWTLPENFPDSRVVNAYLEPAANHDNEKFLWKYPLKEKVRRFCHNVLGWSEQEMDANVDPVLKKFAEKTIQTRIDQHFRTYRDDERVAKIASDRLKTAVTQITGKKSNLSLMGPSKSPAKRKSGETSPVKQSTPNKKLRKTPEK